MSPAVIAECVALVGLLGLSAFFSSAETAFFSLSPTHIHRIRRHRPKMAKHIEVLLAAPTDLLSTILIGNTLVNVAAAALGYAIAEAFLPSLGEAVAIPVMTALIILFGEVTPKRLAMRRPEALAVRYVRPLGVLTALFTPLRLVLNRLARPAAAAGQGRESLLTGAELLTAVDVGHEEGVLNKEERTMVDGIIRLESLRAADVMTPRVDLIGIELDADPAIQLDIARRARLRYLPVYRGDLDHIVGFLDVARFVLAPQPNLQAALFPHFYVPDTAALDDLLTMFQQQDRRLAVVIDEYGGTAGLITRGDILNEIAEFVGELPGENRLRIEPQGSNRWLVNGNTSLEEINYELGLHLEAEGADRIAGWVTAHAERIPKTGDTVEAQGCRATVLQMRKHRITVVQLEKMPSAAPPEPEVFF